MGARFITMANTGPTQNSAGHSPAANGLAIVRVTIGAMLVWVFFENLGKGLYTPAGYAGMINYYTDAAGTQAAVLDLDGADDQHFALMAAPAAARDRIVYCGRRFRFHRLDQSGKRAAARSEHAAAQLGADEPRRLVGAETELALQLQSRDPVGVGRHQISGPEPGGQRQLGVVHDGSGSDRGLATTAGALIGPGLGSSRQALPPPQPGQTNPSGQRVAIRY